jgi:hypothetical protein
MGLALLVTGLSCSNSSDYTYVDVTVTIDPATVSATRLYLVTSCELEVLGPDSAQPLHLPCRENKVPYEVGTFEWTSRAKSGTLQFVVRIFDANRALIGVGTSDPPLPVSPGTHPKTTVLVLGVAPPEGTGSGGIDAGADAESDASAD